MTAPAGCQRLGSAWAAERRRCLIDRGTKQRGCWKELQRHGSWAVLGLLLPHGATPAVAPATRRLRKAHLRLEKSGGTWINLLYAWVVHMHGASKHSSFSAYLLQMGLLVAAPEATGVPMPGALIPSAASLLPREKTCPDCLSSVGPTRAAPRATAFDQPLTDWCKQQQQNVRGGEHPETSVLWRAAPKPSVLVGLANCRAVLYALTMRYGLLYTTDGRFKSYKRASNHGMKANRLRGLTKSSRSNAYCTVSRCVAYHSLRTCLLSWRRPCLE